jgi:hypothetical protein
MQALTRRHRAALCCRVSQQSRPQRYSSPHAVPAYSTPCVHYLHSSGDGLMRHLSGPFFNTAATTAELQSCKALRANDGKVVSRTQVTRPGHLLCQPALNEGLRHAQPLPRALGLLPDAVGASWRCWRAAVAHSRGLHDPRHVCTPPVVLASVA